jgi:3-oxoacyl-[acyl-carrier protein] reductase
MSLECRAEGGKAEGWHLDVFDAGEIKRVAAEIAARFGRLDILINNAGFAAFRHLDNDRFETTWERALAGLLTAQQHLIRAALPFLRNSASQELSISRPPKPWRARRETRRMW